MADAPRPWSIYQTGIDKLGPQDERGRGAVAVVIGTGVSRHPSLAKCVVDAMDFTGSRHGSDDIHGHETHTIGIVAGEDVGVAPGARVHSLKGLGDDGTGSDETTAACVEKAIQIKPHAINMSLGSPARMPRTSAMLRKAVDAGILPVIASGNGGDFSQSWPAMEPFVISVGATDINGTPADFSEPSSTDCACPGVKILSTYLNGGFGILSGTSMSAPWFTGVWMIYVGWCLKNHMTIPPPGEALKLIQQWTRDIAAPGTDAKTGFGLIDGAAFDKYLNSLVKPEPPQPTETWTPTIRFTDRWALCKRA